MQFTSYSFMLFFPIVVGLYMVLPSSFRRVWILLTSLVFVYLASPKYLLVLVTMILFSYLCGLAIDKQKDDKKRKLATAVGVVGTLSILAVCKYIVFFFEIIASVIGLATGSTPACPFKVFLPLGISYYTLSVVGYLVDVYRGKFYAEKNLVDYAAFIAYFPKLLIGPIEQSVFIKQLKLIQHKNLWDIERIKAGAFRMLWGYFEKMVIADNLSPFVNNIFNSYNTLGTVELLAAILVVPTQLLCDFAAGADIAIGIGQIMGLELKENFLSPFYARTTQEFWSRWHKSLTDWLRDYVYIPLGGNRKGRVRKEVNIMLTYMASGLWHAADFHYIVWGALNGVYQVFGSVSKPLWDKLNKKWDIDSNSASYIAFQRLRTYFLFGFGLMYFFMPSTKDIINYMYRMVTKFNPWVIFDGSLFTYGLDAKRAFIMFILSAVYLWVEGVKFAHKQTLPEILRKECIWFRWMVVIVLLLLILIFGVYGSSLNASNFVYFAF